MCHAIPAAASVATTILWCRTKDHKIGQLNLMFYGAAVFSAVDHLVNGEFFLVSANMGQDLMKGVVMSAAVLAVWALGMLWERTRKSSATLTVKS